MNMIWKHFRKWLSLFSVGICLAFAIAACGSPSSQTNQSNNTQADKKEAEIILVSYAVTKRAYSKIIPQFTAAWEQKTGQKVRITESYGGSGSQTRAVIDGLEADITHLALSMDTQKLVKAKLIEPGWEKELPNESIVTNSVVALTVRKGNPKNIKGWEDTVKPGVAIITANPKTSGGARWNFLAIYGAGEHNLKSAEKAEEFTQQLYQNTKVLPKDARESSEVFYKQRQGDVLINYENEVLLAEMEGDKEPFIVPTDVNISIDSPIAVVDANTKRHGTEAISKAFAEFLFTPVAQREFAKVGFRPIEPSIETEFKDKFPKVEKLLTVKDFGGWDTIQTKFFADGASFDKIQSSLKKG